MKRLVGLVLAIGVLAVSLVFAGSASADGSTCLVGRSASCSFGGSSGGSTICMIGGQVDASGNMAATLGGTSTSQFTQTMDASGNITLKCSGFITNLSATGHAFKDFSCYARVQGRVIQTFKTVQKVAVPGSDNRAYTEMSCTFPAS